MELLHALALSCGAAAPNSNATRTSQFTVRQCRAKARRLLHSTTKNHRRDACKIHPQLGRNQQQLDYSKTSSKEKPLTTLKLDAQIFVTEIKYHSIKPPPEMIVCQSPMHNPNLHESRALLFNPTFTSPYHNLAFSSETMMADHISTTSSPRNQRTKMDVQPRSTSPIQV